MKKTKNQITKPTSKGKNSLSNSKKEELRYRGCLLDLYATHCFFSYFPLLCIIVQLA